MTAFTKQNGLYRPTRRDFLKHSLAAGAGFAATSYGLSGSAGAAAPKSGGHMKLSLSGAATTDTLEVGQMGDTFRRVIGFASRGNLAEYMPDGSAKPELAESWESSNGAKTWRFKLRNGVTFSNGKSLTPEDVVASLNMHRGEKSTSAMKEQFQIVSDIKADGKDVVEITLSSGQVDFPTLLSIEMFNICPVVDGKLDQSGVGAGPYILKEFEPGVRALLERNPNSYKSGFIDSAEMLGVSDATARQQAIMSGEVDVMFEADLKFLDRLGKVPGLRVESYAGRHTVWIGMRMLSAPFDNEDVRMALKYGVDRQEMVDKIMHGYGRIGNDQPITPAYPLYNPDLKARAYDPDKAKFHLKKAGMESLNLNFQTSDVVFSGAADFAQLFQQQATKYGVNINVNRQPADSYWNMLDTNTTEFYNDGWGGFTTEDAMLSMSLAAGAPWNHSMWADKEFNAMLVAARGEEDETKRRQMYYHLQEIVSDRAGVVIPIFADWVHVVKDRVKNSGQFSSNLELDGNRCIERWWIDEA